MKSLLLSAVLFVAYSFALRAEIGGGAVDNKLAMGPAPGGKFLVKWQAAAGTTQLYWAGSLADPATWQPLGGAVALGNNLWQKEVPGSPPRAFFQLRPPAGPPSAPPNVRLVMTGDHFRLEWDSTSDAAAYVVTLRQTADGPPVQQLTLPAANALEITGLTTGQLYFITLAATNAAGLGAPAAAVSGVYGPKGSFGGRAVWSFPDPGCPTCGGFQVEASGAEIHLTSFALPGGAGWQAVADEDGQFHIPDVPTGIYTIGYSVNGQAGFLPDPLVVTEGGVTRAPLVLPSGPVTPANTLYGLVTLSGGDPPRLSLPEFGINAKAELTATFADGSSRMVIPDNRGAWAMTDLTGGFPVTLTAHYQGLTATLAIAAPLARLAPWTFQFVEQLPQLQRITMYQGGAEVMQITEGQPVTLTAEVSNPLGLSLEPHWILESNGGKFTSTEAAPTFTFGSGGLPLNVDTTGGIVRITYLPKAVAPPVIGPRNVVIGPPVPLAGTGCWSGRTGTWSPAAPDNITPAHPATVTVTHSGFFSPLSANTTLNQNGLSYAELPLDPATVPPYLVRVDRPGHMRFLWPFPFVLPKEATFCVVPAVTTNHTQAPGTLTVTHSSGMSLALPYGALFDNFAQPWLGNIIVRMVAWDPLVRDPLPPGAESRGPGPREGIHAYSGGWFEITTDTGIPLTPAGTATLTLPTTLNYNSAVIPAYHQDETTGFFENWGAAPDYEAAKTAPGRYTMPLGGKGLFLLAWPNPLVEPIFSADRSINYPFEMRVDKSIFSITVTGPGTHSMGKLFMPVGWGVSAQVLDLRQGPGINYVTPATASFINPVEPMRKRLITSVGTQLSAPIAQLPLITPVPVLLTLGDAEPKLKTQLSDTTVTALNPANKFLSRASSTAADAAAYYAKIKAPATLALWRTLNGFPAAFGGPIPGASVENYATGYYYNLGDLGFARAQTMRITTGPDNQPDVAFAVTNYLNLEDAYCKRFPVATVCMDNSLRTDTGTQAPARYTRFYVYNGQGNLLDCANLDGAGLKCVPNLCVICHGGNHYTAGGTANLGSRFLPFDVESYNFHHKYGVQKQEFAAMNKGVLKTAPGAAITDLITGWYGNANPLAAFAVWNAFNQNFVPSAPAVTWSDTPAHAAQYADIFKHGCRVCHISRDATNFVQFESWADLDGAGYGQGSVCGSLSMPHSQRTWGIFWGGRCSTKLGVPGAVDMPTLLGNASGLPCRP